MKTLTHLKFVIQSTGSFPFAPGIPHLLSKFYFGSCLTLTLAKSDISYFCESSLRRPIRFNLPFLPLFLNIWRSNFELKQFEENRLFWIKRKKNSASECSRMSKKVEIGLQEKHFFKKRNYFQKIMIQMKDVELS